MPTGALESYSSYGSEPIGSMQQGALLYQSSSFQLPGSKSGMLPEGALAGLHKEPQLSGSSDGSAAAEVAAMTAAMALQYAKRL